MEDSASLHRKCNIGQGIGRYDHCNESSSHLHYQADGRRFYHHHKPHGGILVISVIELPYIIKTMMEVTSLQSPW